MFLCYERAQTVKVTSKWYRNCTGYLEGTMIWMIEIKRAAVKSSETFALPQSCVYICLFMVDYDSWTCQELITVARHLGIFPCGTAPKTVSNQLHVIVNRATRLMSFALFGLTHFNPLCEILEILKVDDMYMYTFWKLQSLLTSRTVVYYLKK